MLDISACCYFFASFVAVLQVAMFFIKFFDPVYQIFFAAMSSNVICYFGGGISKHLNREITSFAFHSDADGPNL